VETTGVAQHHGTNLQKSQPDTIALAMSQSGVGKSQTAYPFRQSIIQTRRQQLELVGPLAMTIGVVKEQIQLLFFDAVLHLPPQAVEIIV
jgi:hypothetical protein